MEGAVCDGSAALDDLVTAGLAAVLDVWWNSIFRLPSGGVGPSNWPSKHRFDLLPNVIMSPHESGRTAESEEEAIKEVASNLDALSLGKPLSNVVRKGKPPAA